MFMTSVNHVSAGAPVVRFAKKCAQVVNLVSDKMQISTFYSLL